MLVETSDVDWSASGKDSLCARDDEHICTMSTVNVQSIEDWTFGGDTDRNG